MTVPANDYGARVTAASTGRISAPGAGSPCTALMSADRVRGTQNVATSSPLDEPPNGTPVRTIAPPPLVGKHGTCEFVEQQTCEMPPLASVHRPSASTATQAVPVQAAVQVPEPHASSAVCGPAASAHGTGPGSTDVPVVSSARMSTVLTSWLGGGTQLLDSV